MTIKAHGTRRVYRGASRTRDSQNQSATSDFFNELHPHLKNVVIKQQTLAERIYSYLVRCGPRTLQQMTTKFGDDRGRVQRCLLANVAMFERTSAGWLAKRSGDAV